MLDAGDLTAFDTAFPVVGQALSACDAPARHAAMPLLFGDFTRRAIAAGFDRTRFVAWLGPAEILIAPAGRARGRVLWFKNAKGHGRILGTNGAIHFVHFSMFRETDLRRTAGGFLRPIDGGELVEFTPQYATFNNGPGFGAYDAVCLNETGQSKTP
jgi:hypothetical protein